MDTMVTKKYGLTQSQLLLWAGQKLNPEAPLHNTAHMFDISYDIDHQLFSKAFQATINSTDALRINFIDEGDSPTQYVRDSLEFIPELIDLSTESDEELIKDTVRNRSQMKLDLSKRVFDCALFKISENRNIWFLNLHHLITDAISSAEVYRRVADLYVRLEKGEIVSDITHPSFIDYVKLEQNSYLDHRNQEITDYWDEKTRGIDNHPIYYGANNKNSTTRASRVSLKLGKERTEKLKELAKLPTIRSWTTNLTMFNLLATVFFSFLHRISGQNKIVVGAPAHNRVNNRLRSTVGLFIEIFPLIIEFSKEDTFDTVLERLKIEANQYLRYAQPGYVRPHIGSSFNVVLNYINASFSNFNDVQIESEWIHTGHIDITHQIRCHVVDFDTRGDIELLFDLNHATFDKDLSEMVPQHFLYLLDAFLEDQTQSIYAPGLATPREIEQTYLKNEVDTDQETVIDQFKKQVQENPESIALHFEDETMTYLKLNRLSDQLGNHLLSQGVKQGDRLVFHFERSPEYIVAVLAALKIGVAFVPVPSNQSQQRIDFIIRDSQASMVLTSKSLKRNLPEIEIECLILDDLENEKSKANVPLDYFTSAPEDTVYIIYTSGSTGNPKGVLVPQKALSNYIAWAQKMYDSNSKFIFPFFTSIGFDLTITSLFLPLTTGGKMVIYKESYPGPDISLIEVLNDNKVNCIKLTPSHLKLIQRRDLSDSKIKTMIVGGEDFRLQLAQTIESNFGPDLKIYNEYGPTEATVGCIVSLFDNKEHNENSVPIGKVIDGMRAYILDSHKNIVPNGVVGQLHLSGVGLAKGYANLPGLTAEKFVDSPFDNDERLYDTGDLARLNKMGEIEYLGRVDEQIKLRGHRIELSDIEVNMEQHSLVENAAVVLIEKKITASEDKLTNCTDCGLPSNYPGTDFDENGVCHICNTFKDYRQRALRYFKTEEDLKEILLDPNLDEEREYDCLSLLSGGKDSTYILAQLKRMGLKILAFTLDNGYISEQAKDNINNIVTKMGIDHIYGSTKHMNNIFVDSLHRHHNVCNGCFKTIYTLSTKIALEKKIPFVVTGLSRGQFFETRLTPELFSQEEMDTAYIDNIILEARKLYHQEDDAVKTLLDTEMFQNDATFQKVQFIDYYRYTDVSLEEMIRVLEDEIGWRRPSDTGRSTNCLINQLGIYVHKKQQGYSNYAYPYSWDVRMGHKTRQESLDEINEFIDEAEVHRIMKEIGYDEPGEILNDQEHLVAYYTGSSPVPSMVLLEHLKKDLPDYMMPRFFKYVDQLPLNANGKVDKESLKQLSVVQLDLDTAYVAPNGEIEEYLASIWKEVLQLERVGSEDNFISLGGHSLAAIRVSARVKEEFELDIPLNKIFELPTISLYGKHLEDTIISLLEES